MIESLVSVQTLVNADLVEVQAEESSSVSTWSFVMLAAAMLAVAGLVLKNQKRRLIENNIQERLIEEFQRV